MAMKYLLDRPHSDAEYVLHLGDGSMEFERLSPHYPRMAFLNVLGNCDWGFGNSAGLQRTLDIDGVRIFMCHGHRHDVSGGDMHILSACANSQKADIALFGHTHYSEYFKIRKPGVQNEDAPCCALHIMNPGSITRPRGGTVKGKSYGLILLDGKGGFDISLHPYDE